MMKRGLSFSGTPCSVYSHLCPSIVDDVSRCLRLKTELLPLAV